MGFPTASTLVSSSSLTLVVPAATTAAVAAVPATAPAPSVTAAPGFLPLSAWTSASATS